jgi:hypothetical protein
MHGVARPRKESFCVFSAPVIAALLVSCVPITPLQRSHRLSRTFMPFWAFLMLTLSARIAYLRAYEEANKSILATRVFHTSLKFSI